MKINFLKSVKDILKFIIYFFFSKIIIYSIFTSNFKVKVLYPNRYGFGDYLFFCVNIRKKLNIKNKIFCFSQLQYETANFFFEKQYIVKSFILMPRFLNESHLGYNFLDKHKLFRPINLKILAPDGKKVPISDFFVGTTNVIKFIKKKISRSKISPVIVNIFKKTTICLFIKNFSKYKNNNINFQVRQTRDLSKIQKLIYFLNKKKINTIILGTEKDQFIKFFSAKIKEQILKNVFLFKDLSVNYSIADQAYVALKSIGYIGSLSGANSFFGLLNKKAILIDAVFHYNDKFYKNFFFLYKKIYNKKTKNIEKFIWKKNYNPTIYKIIETKYSEIKEALLKNFINKLT